MEQIMKDKIKYKSKEEIENDAFRFLRKLNNKSLLNNKNVDCFLMGYKHAISDIKEQISAQRKDEFIDYLEQMKIFCSECYHNLENDLSYAGYQFSRPESADAMFKLYEVAMKSCDFLIENLDNVKMCHTDYYDKKNQRTKEWKYTIIMEENDKYKLTFTGDNLIGRAICRTEDGPKYKLTDETTNLLGRTLYRIEALKDFGDVKKGDKGGYVENHSNLSQYGNCWIYDTAKVYSTGYVWGNASICDNAHVYDGACVYDDAIVSGNVYVYDHARICGDAKISELQDYMVFKNWWSDGNLFTWTRSNNMWRTSFFYGTGDELIKNVYQDDEESAREYERVVKYVEDVLKSENNRS